jgi:hypothetical protein
MKKCLSILAVLAMLTLITGVQAQEVEPQIAYYLAADAEDVQQVYQLVMYVESQAQQLTNAENDVITFGVSDDSQSIAYISDGQLWLQPTDSEQPEALTELDSERFFSDPVFSHENQFIAYADNGVWLFDLQTREKHQILEDIEPDPNASNAEEVRVYRPKDFVLGEDEKAEYLVVDVGVWEANTVGVYDLGSDEFQELQGLTHTDLLPLSDGRVLLYGSSPVGFGSGTLNIADVQDINTSTEVFELLPIDDNPLFAEQAVEIEPGIVRVFGTIFGQGLTPDENHYFYFDFDVETSQAGDVNIITPGSSEESQNTAPGDLSPDGRLLPFYLNVQLTDFGKFYGQLKLVDVTEVEAIEVELPQTVGIVRWQE